MSNIYQSIRKDEEKIHARLCDIAYHLEVANEKKYATVIARMRDGSYLDFTSQLPMPKSQMHKDLVAAGLIGLDQKMQDGEFDT